MAPERLLPPAHQQRADRAGGRADASGAERGPHRDAGRAQAPPPMTRLTLARIDRIDLGAAGHLVLRGGRGAQVVTVAGA